MPDDAVELPSDASRAIEAVLMVAEQPVAPHLLAQLVELSPERVEAICAELDATYRRDGRGFVILRAAGGYRLASHPDQDGYVERFILEGESARLSAAALETLAIVAYKQPVSRVQVAAIRGDGNRVYRFILASRTLAQAREDELLEAARSFRRIPPEEARSVRPQRIDIVTVRPGETVEYVSRQMAFEDHRLERFRALNGLTPADRVRPGQKVKVVVR